MNVRNIWAIFFLLNLKKFFGGNRGLPRPGNFLFFQLVSSAFLSLIQHLTLIFKHILWLNISNIFKKITISYLKKTLNIKK